MDAIKTLDEDDLDIEPDQFLADLPDTGRVEEASTAIPSSILQPTPSISSAGEPQERRAQVGASPYLAPFTPSGSPPRPKTPSTASGRSVNSSSRAAKPQIVPVSRSVGAGAFGASSLLPKDDVVKHLPPKLVETLADIIRTLDQLADGVADFRPEQLGFLSDKAQRYVELLQQADKAAVDYSADIPLEVLKMIEKGMNPELFTKSQLDKCQEESTQAAGRVETFELLKGALQSGLNELK
ncbi:rna polymerase ii mediator complex subunit 10 [Plasmopara halstedii]|uniref:Mediator of RNA polymerase II transcription subunit 10 n=1 Tax=Plasmopara halstedii TaxID=4781 RepID=A0A0P1B4N8_PLAHL|nr:rna polymerase ii mediator complex subunit 10 [Plasmopara halstedii]CEG49729.1 rna polymerase ii mediator complex subunit 10 [Plasmopara halstedii]|eukprot:XP_024586098.1 rna polymerase ii mediator complex subunit 10 [Plasmopara halstedii]